MRPLPYSTPGSIESSASNAFAGLPGRSDVTDGSAEHGRNSQLGGAPGEALEAYTWVVSQMLSRE